MISSEKLYFWRERVSTTKIRVLCQSGHIERYFDSIVLGRDLPGGEFVIRLAHLAFCCGKSRCEVLRVSASYLG